MSAFSSELAAHARSLVRTRRRFADLGSGMGRAVLQSVEQYNVTTACGIEMAPSRHEGAMAALARAPELVCAPWITLTLQ